MIKISSNPFSSVKHQKGKKFWLGFTAIFYVPVFYDYRKLFWVIFLQNLLSCIRIRIHFTSWIRIRIQKNAGSGSAKNECRSTALPRTVESAKIWPLCCICVVEETVLDRFRYLAFWSTRHLGIPPVSGRLGDTKRLNLQVHLKFKKYLRFDLHPLVPVISAVPN